MTIDHVLDNKWLSFPCVTHKDEVIAKILHFYGGLRMRQYCKQKKKEQNTQAEETVKT